jgi:C4-dicarboxylate transporter DctM subunit
MVLYGVFVGISVTNLFIAGILPGVLIGVALTVIAIYISIREKYVSESAFSITVAAKTFVAALPALVLPLIILGGIMGGVFTPTEAAAVSVVYVLLVGIFVERDLTPAAIYRALKETALLTGTVMIVISVAGLLGWVFSYARIPQLLVAPFLTLTESPVVFMWIVSVLLIVAGTFLHGTALLVVLVPLFLPIVRTMGIHPLQFAMVVMMCWGIGQQTPPVGSSIYITCTLADIDMWELTKANMPFLAALVLILALIIHAPGFSVLWIPRLLGLI